MPPSIHEATEGLPTPQAIPMCHVAVAGNPNSGKSTLINSIAGSRLHVGNWAGVTVERKEATLPYQDMQIHFVDLPGTYSLSPYTQEEVIARDHLVLEAPNLIVNVVDATNLERNLYLTMQLLELGLPMILALNMYDEAEAKGFQFDLKELEELLGIPVIPTIATTGRGKEDLLKAIHHCSNTSSPRIPREQHFEADMEKAIGAVQSQVLPQLKTPYASRLNRWLSMKLLEGDSHVMEQCGLDESWAIPEEIRHHLQTAHDADLESLFTDARYAKATGLSQETLKRPAITKMELTERIDRIVLNRYLGIPVFLMAMWFVFKLTFDIANPFIDWVDGVFTGPFAEWVTYGLTSMGASAWVISLFTEGILAGCGFVLVFVPIIFTMMFAITFLEASGYMARAAFVMDRAMHKIGLHGKSFIPMLLGFGCNVPSVYATRTLENDRDKILTCLLVPFMSCGARLPVYVLFVGVFFGSHSGTVLWSLYLLGIIAALAMGLIFKRTLFRGEAPAFIMELPPYRMPTLQNLWIHTWEKGKHFLTKAGTYIFIVSIFVWILLNLPWGVESRKDSYLGQAGQTIAPVLAPIGFGDWEAASSLLTGIIAKEIVVGTMGEIYVPSYSDTSIPERPDFSHDLLTIGQGFTNATREAFTNLFGTLGIATITAETDPDTKGLQARIQKQFTPLKAYSFMAFVLLYIPCVITMIAMRQEFGSWKWPLLATVNGLVLAWVVSFVIYQGGLLLGLA